MALSKYESVINDMRWSFSRVNTFETCPHMWYLRYIEEREEEKKFYSEYGTLVHKIIQKYYDGEIKKNDMMTSFISGFVNDIECDKPDAKIVLNYLNAGIEYFKNFQGFPYNVIGVEKYYRFEVNGIKFAGIIDFLGEKDGDIYIVDNKSKSLTKRSKRGKKNNEELDKTLRQLYLYSIPVINEFGKPPKYLCINCFRTGEFITEEFNEEKFKEAIQWATDLINQIVKEEDFKPNVNQFFCKWICGNSESCDYYKFEKDMWRLNNS